MAGRKSKTATVDKPKATQKASASSVAKGDAVSNRSPKAGTKAQAKTKTKTKTQASAVGKAGAAVGATKARAGVKTGSKILNQVIAAAKSVKRKSKMATGDPSARTKRKSAVSIYTELERLAAYIDAAKREIAQIRPQDVKEEYLPGATDQLDAVVEATAVATNTIMDSCDEIEGVMGEVSDGVAAKLMGATTRIYEACTFQDITGQRIGKVVTALKNIEERIDALVLTFGDETMKSQKKSIKPKPKQKKPITDADLLEGPQLDGTAKNQAEIDDLLASFD